MTVVRSNGRMPEELVFAIGLIWGHLKAYQFEQAHALAQGCLKLWPDEPRLQSLAVCAAVETGHPLDQAGAALLHQEENQAWAGSILRRAQTNPPSSEKTR